MARSNFELLNNINKEIIILKKEFSYVTEVMEKLWLDSFGEGEQITKEWFFMTGKYMNPSDLHRLTRNYRELNERNLLPSNYGHLKDNWLLLTGPINSSNIDDLRKKYLTKINLNSFELLKRNWSLFTGEIDPYDLDQLQRDYVVLNWAKMRFSDHKRLKKNWILFTKRTGTDTLEDIIKGWLVNYLQTMEYRYMSNQEKIEYTKLCLERGADVNTLSPSEYSLLHVVIEDKLIMYAPLVELLLQNGADVTIRNPDGMTPLDSARIYYYKDHEEIVNLLQIAAKSGKDYNLTNTDGSQALKNKEMQDKDIRNNVESHSNSEREGIHANTEQCKPDKEFPSRCDHNKIQKHWLLTNESIYLSRVSDLFKQATIADIDFLLMSIINYMFVSNIQSTYYIKINQGVSRHDNIAKIHQIYSKMCSRLFHVFDSEFNESIDIRFPTTADLCDNAELVILIEIHPEVEWVALKMFAVPWNIEYYVLCAAGMRIKCKLSRDYQKQDRIHTEDLFERYEK